MFLTLRATTIQAAVSTAASAASVVTLSATSAAHHLGTWSPQVRRILRSVDHAKILILIAGTYTPVAILALHGAARIAILAVVWASTVLGAVFRVALTGLLRWVYVPFLP